MRKARRRTGDLSILHTPYTSIGDVRAANGRVYFLGGSPTEPSSVVQLNRATGSVEVLRRTSTTLPDPGYLSRPQTVQFPTTGGNAAYGFYFPPQNQDYGAPADERPPLLVNAHGGPTGFMAPTLSLSIQFWTSRGFGVLAVNYGGSSGYGREYRERLAGQWGVVDVDDCVAGARYLVDKGEVDGRRLAIRGGSAGGYTTLCALTFRDIFTAGGSHFGISELTEMATDTHKFESRYLEGLIGPLQEVPELYRERSPLYFIDRLTAPVILFQGLEDRVVPPNQAEMIVDALRKSGRVVAYLALEGEQHGFRRAESIRRVLEAEMYFYSRVFHFPLPGTVEPIEIYNLPA